MPFSCFNLDELEDQLAIYNLELSDLQDELALLQADLSDAESLLNQYESNLENQKQLLSEKQIELATAKRELQTLKNSLAFLRLNLAKLEKEKADIIAYIQSQPEIKSIWCADYTLDLSGEVGLADVPGEMNAIQIRQGYEGRATYNSSRDGILQHAKASSPANTWLQACLMPAVRKWKPQYRHGTITGINYGNDTCSVSLAESTSQYLTDVFDINTTYELNNIPIVYMECNADPFLVGDKVLIEYPDRKTPKVVGYYEHPRVCEFDCTEELCNTFAWDFENNPLMGNTGTQVAIYVLNGCPPYTWTVTANGSGWSFANTETYNPNNILTIGCGSALITVSCECGTLQDDLFAIRSADGGEWGNSTAGCSLPGGEIQVWDFFEDPTKGGMVIGRYVSGAKRQNQYYYVVSQLMDGTDCNSTDDCFTCNLSTGEFRFPNGDGIYDDTPSSSPISYNNYCATDEYWDSADPDACTECLSGFYDTTPPDGWLYEDALATTRISADKLCNCHIVYKQYFEVGNPVAVVTKTMVCIKNIGGPSWQTWIPTETCGT